MPNVQFSRLLALASRIAPAPLPTPERDVEVTSVVQDHRLVTPGAVFVARAAQKFDAHAFIPAAIAAGAVAIVAERAVPADVPVVVVPDTRAVLPALAAAMHGFPAEQLRLIGVTGTDGKTTTATIVHALLRHLEAEPVGLLSTALTLVGQSPVPGAGRFTTPEATEVHALLHAFVDAGVQTAVIETSSHGFALQRLDTLAFAVGVFTNVTPEHLDFHGTLHEYIRAKATLAERSRRMVVNADDAAAHEFTKRAAQVVSYGRHPDATLRISHVEPVHGGTAFTLSTATESVHTYVPLIGDFNAANAAAAVLAVQQIHPDASLAQLAQLLQTVPPVPGRMEVVTANPFLAVIDFAHTPPAVETVLTTLRTQTNGRLIAVLGAAGERDPGKREALGRIAGSLADVVFFTEEDSRSEDVHTIIAALQHGATGTPATTHAVPDRTEAIQAAVMETRSGDTVVFLGKGPEATLERADVSLPWNENKTVQEAIDERLRRQ